MGPLPLTQALPFEILMQIVEAMEPDPAILASLSRVDKTFYAVCTQDVFYRSWVGPNARHEPGGHPLLSPRWVDCFRASSTRVELTGRHGNSFAELPSKRFFLAGLYDFARVHRPTVRKAQALARAEEHLFWHAQEHAPKLPWLATRPVPAVACGVTPVRGLLQWSLPGPALATYRTLLRDLFEGPFSVTLPPGSSPDSELRLVEDADIRQALLRVEPGLVTLLGLGSRALQQPCRLGEEQILQLLRQEGRLYGALRPLLAEPVQDRALRLALHSDSAAFYGRTDGQSEQAELVHLAAKDSYWLLGLAGPLFRDSEAHMQAHLARHGMALEFCSARLRQNRDLVLLALAQNGLALQFAAPALRDDLGIVRAAVQQNGLALQYAGAQTRGATAIVHRAVAQNGLALQFAGDGLKDSLMVATTAVEQDGCALAYASLRLRSEPLLVRRALRQNGRALKFAAGELQAWEALAVVATQHKDPLRVFLSPYFLNHAHVALEAVRGNGMFLNDVSARLRGNKTIALAAISQCPGAYRFCLPPAAADAQVIEAALTGDIEVFRFLAPMHRGAHLPLQLFSTALRQDPGLYERCWRPFDDNALICHQLFSLHPSLMVPIARTEQDRPELWRQFVLRALAEDPLTLRFFADAITSDPSFVGVAVKKNGLSLAYATGAAKHDWRTALLAVQQNGLSLVYVPDGVRFRQDILAAALNNNFLAMEFVPQGQQNLPQFERARTSWREVHAKFAATPNVASYTGSRASEESWREHWSEQVQGTQGQGIAQWHTQGNFSGQLLLYFGQRNLRLDPPPFLRRRVLPLGPRQPPPLLNDFDNQLPETGSIKEQYIFYPRDFLAALPSSMVRRRYHPDGRPKPYETAADLPV